MAGAARFISQLFTPKQLFRTGIETLLGQCTIKGRTALCMFHRPCLSEGGDNFLGEMPWHAAWDRVYLFRSTWTSTWTFTFDIYIDFHIDIHIDIYTDIYTDIYIDIYIDTYSDI